jgi:hypothetical protein
MSTSDGEEAIVGAIIALAAMYLSRSGIQTLTTTLMLLSGNTTASTRRRDRRKRGRASSRRGRKE